MHEIVAKDRFRQMKPYKKKKKKSNSFHFVIKYNVYCPRRAKNYCSIEIKGTFLEASLVCNYGLSPKKKKNRYN